jgi:signal transduction histidine kinase
VETALFRIAQEAVLNAAKHSSATHVLISVIEQETRRVPERVRRWSGL